MTLQDGSATAVVHVHGRWAGQPQALAEALRAGHVQVHVHTDGSLHAHDVTG